MHTTRLPGWLAGASLASSYFRSPGVREHTGVETAGQRELAKLKLNKLKLTLPGLSFECLVHVPRSVREESRGMHTVARIAVVLHDLRSVHLVW